MASGTISSSSSTLQNDLFSSLISDIKTYSGKDPLLPWLRGIRKMRESLPSQLLKQKLPRFLQKCAQTFETDRHYANDLRYLRVWLQLMDFVDDPRAILRTMESNHIGMKRSLFYQAYALYYEKVKKFEEAEKMYHLGVQNLAEPIDELQKSYEQFVHRMQRHKNKRIQRQEMKIIKRPLSARNLPLNHYETKVNSENCENVVNKVLEGSSQNEMSIKGTNENVVRRSPSVNDGVLGINGHMGFHKHQENVETKSDDTVVVKFVDRAIIGRSVAEDACHHGLVEPTINTKEALNAINSMFREPIEPALVGRRSRKTLPKADPNLNNGFEVFVDENTDNMVRSSNQNVTDSLMPGHNIFQSHEPCKEPLHIYFDNGESNDVKEIINAFVFPSPKDLPAESPEDLERERSAPLLVREDTVVCRFVGSTISDEPEVENVCHHGLVEPTVNLKEAMDDINSMFGKPIDFVRTKRSKKQDKLPEKNNSCGGFVILQDDEMDLQPRKSRRRSYAKHEHDLFEPTMCTKEAMDEINKMFGMPMDL